MLTLQQYIICYHAILMLIKTQHAEYLLKRIGLQMEPHSNNANADFTICLLSQWSNVGTIIAQCLGATSPHTIACELNPSELQLTNHAQECLNNSIFVANDHPTIGVEERARAVLDAFAECLKIGYAAPPPGPFVTDETEYMVYCKDHGISIGQVLQSFLKQEFLRTSTSNPCVFLENIDAHILHWFKSPQTFASDETQRGEYEMEYRKYQWYWLLDHDFTLSNLLSSAAFTFLMDTDDADDLIDVINNPSDIEFAYNGLTNGICGCFYVCYDEFCDYELKEFQETN